MLLNLNHLALESSEEDAILRSYFFFSQSAIDIRRKPQKLEIDPERPTFHLVKVIYWMFKTRDVEEEDSEDEKA